MTTLRSNAPRPRDLPSDVRDLTGERALLDFALHAAANLNIPDSALIDAQPFGARMMLTLSSYCYAAGIHASRDIERAIYTDETVRYICARQYPSWLDIRRFRRQHRELIQESLVVTLKQVWMSARAAQQNVADCDMAEIDQELQSVAASRIEAAMILDRAEIDL